MLVGSVLALSQSDVKRLLAYCSIAHAGFLLVGIAAVRNSAAAPTAAVLFYLAAYGFATIGAFAIVMLVRNAGGEATHLSNWAGLARRSPVLAAAMALFMLAFAGIPLTSGFMGKWVVFSSAWSAGGWPLVLVGVLASVVAAVFYLRVIVVMYFSRPAADGPVVASPSRLTTLTIAVGCGRYPTGCASGDPVMSRRLAGASRCNGPRVRWGDDVRVWGTCRVARPGLDGPAANGDARRRQGACRRRPRRASVHHRGGPDVMEAGASGSVAGRRCWSQFGDPDGSLARAALGGVTHVATLYHDDVNDEADVRRGRRSPTPAGTNNIANHDGRYLFARAADIISGLGAEAVRIQARTFSALVQGQIRGDLAPPPARPDRHSLSVVGDKMRRWGHVRPIADVAGAPPRQVEDAGRAPARARGSPSSSPTTSSTWSPITRDSARRPAPICVRASPTLPVCSPRVTQPGVAGCTNCSAATCDRPGSAAEALRLLRSHPATDAARAEVLRRAASARALLEQLPPTPRAMPWPTSATRSPCAASSAGRHSGTG